MNAQFPDPSGSLKPRATTRAGEGFDRKSWTVDELYAMVDAGILHEDSKVELIEGELLAMNAKHNEHEIWKRNMVRFLVRATTDDIAVSVEPTLVLGERSAPEPDIVVYPARLKPLDVRGGDVLLLVEVSDSSEHRDLRLKAGLYAKHAVAAYWVLDTRRRRVVVHTGPEPEGYARVESFGLEHDLALPFAPGALLKLSSLEKL